MNVPGIEVEKQRPVGLLLMLLLLEKHSGTDYSC